MGLREKQNIKTKKEDNYSKTEGQLDNYFQQTR